MIDTNIILGGLVVSIALLMLAPDWRPAFVLLCVCGGLLTVLNQHEIQALGGAGSLLTLHTASDIAALICVAAILLWTGLTYDRHHEQLASDEVVRMQLRRAARRAASALMPQGWAAYRLPVFALLLLLAGTVLLPEFYSSPATPSVYAWTLALLGGILIVATSDSLLKLGMGLTLMCLGLKLCYLTEAPGVGLFVLMLFSFVPIVVALVTALLSTLVFARLGTLRLALLFEQARPASADTVDRSMTTQPSTGNANAQR